MSHNNAPNMNENNKFIKIRELLFKKTKIKIREFFPFLFLKKIKVLRY